MEEEIGDTTERKEENKSLATIILRYHHYALDYLFNSVVYPVERVMWRSLTSPSSVKLKKEEHSQDNDKRDCICWIFLVLPRKKCLFIHVRCTVAASMLFPLTEEKNLFAQ